MSVFKIHGTDNNTRPFPWKALVFGLCILLWLILSVLMFLPDELIRRSLHTWNVYHYVIGTKYFNELGYFDLYRATLLASDDGEPIFPGVSRTRDLRTYKKTSVENTVKTAKKDNLRDRFTLERWTEFKSDLETLKKQRPNPDYWRGPLRDRGFNGTPFWLLFHEPLLNGFDLQRENILFFLCYAQHFLFFIVLVLFYWAFGVRIMIAFMAFITLFFGNWLRYVGGYFSYDWLFFSAISLVFYSKKRYPISGVFLAMATLSRGFPLLLAAYPVLAFLGRLVRFRKPRAHHAHYLMGLALAGVLLFGMTSSVSHGFNSWLEWKDKISVHAEHHPSAGNRVGFRMLFTRDYEKGHLSLNQGERRRTLEKYESHFFMGAAILTALTVLAMLRRRDRDGILLGIGLIFFWITLSRYYFSIFGLIVAWTAMDPRSKGNFLAHAWLFLTLFIGAFLWALPSVKDAVTYYVFNWLVAIYFLVIVLNFLAKDIRWFIRTRKLGKRGGYGAVA